MIGIAGRRRLVGGGSGALPAGPYYTDNSAVFHKITDRASSVFHAPGGSFGTVDTTATAVVTADAGGTGIHAFNPSSATSVRRWSRYTAFPGSTLSVYSLDLKNHAGDSGKKVAIAIWNSAGSVVAHTVVTLTGTLTTYTVSFATTPGQNYYCGPSNDVALGADSGARAYVGVQNLSMTGASGTLADYTRLHIAPTHWLYNLETFTYPPGGYWANESNVGQEASTHAFLAIETNADEIVVETMSTMYQGYVNSGYTIAASTGVTVKVAGSFVDVKSTADGVAELLTVPLTGALENIEVYNCGRNAIAAGWVGSHYRAIYVARGKAFTLGTQPAPKSRVIAAVGDSITSGFAGQPMAQYSWAAQLRGLLNCDVYDDGTGGIIAYNLSGTSTQERADKIATCNPTDITLALGTNDWQQENAGFQSLANYEIYMGALIDAFHATIPGATIHVLAIWNKTHFETDGPNGQSHTIDDFRNRLIKLVVDRGSPSWLRCIKVVDWTVYAGFVNDDYKAGVPGMINDDVHPNNSGQTKMANKLAAVIPATKLTLSPATPTLAHSTGQTFTASGGSGSGRVFSLWRNDSGGSINASTGVYTAGASTGTDVVMVVDSHGQMGFAVVTVT